MRPDVNVFLYDFHDTKGNEMVCLNEDDSYTILINSRLDRESAIKAYIHALRHIDNDDFDKTDVQEIEYRAHLAS